MKTTFYKESSVANVSKEDFKKRVLEEQDFIKSHKYGNSLSKYLIRNPKPADDAVIARLLLISEEEVEEIYQKTVDILKKGVVGSENES